MDTTSQTETIVVDMSTLNKVGCRRFMQVAVAAGTVNIDGTVYTRTARFAAIEGQEGLGTGVQTITDTDDDPASGGVGKIQMITAANNGAGGSTESAEPDAYPWGVDSVKDNPDVNYPGTVALFNLTGT